MTNIVKSICRCRTDDWMSKPSNGASTIISPPTSDQERLFSTSYNYCTTNWCQDSTNSLFTLRSDESFDDINKCATPYIDVVETAVSSLVNDPTINQELYDICTKYDNYGIGKQSLDLSCVVDGLCGDTNDAQNARNDRQDIESTHDLLWHYSNYPTQGNVSAFIKSFTFLLKSYITGNFIKICLFAESYAGNHMGC